MSRVHRNSFVRASLVLLLHTCWLETILASQPPPPPPPPPPHSVTANNGNKDSIPQKAKDDYIISQPPFVNALQESKSSDGTTLVHEKKTETTFITRQQAESFGTMDDDTISTRQQQQQQQQQRLDLSQGEPTQPPPPPPLTTREHTTRVPTVEQEEQRQQILPNEQEWIVPQRYRNPYGLPDPKISPDQSQFGTLQEEYSQSDYYRQQTPNNSRIQQPQMHPRQLAPRDYNYNRIPPREQYHEQRLVVRNSQQYQQRQGFGRSLLQRIGKSLDVLADADTVVSKQAQKLVSSVPSISESIAGNISGAVRGTVFEVINRGTGIKEAMKDTVKGSVSTIFGGAPTTASETQDAWEQDRRKTVTETRRRTLLGTTSGETYTGTGTSPLQEHLNMLMEEQNKQERDHVKNVPDDKDEFKVDSDTNNHVNDNHYANDNHFYGDTPQNVDDDGNLDWTQHTDSGVDPQTFFQTRTPLSSYASQETSSYAKEDEDEESSFSSNFKRLFHLRMKPRRMLFFHRKTSDSFSDAGWGDEDDDIQPKIIKKPSKRSVKFNHDARKVNSEFEESLLRRQQKASPLAQKGTVNLLSTKDLQYLSRIGKSKATMDFLSIFFLYTAAYEASKYISFEDVLTDSFPDSVQELIQTAKLFIPSCDTLGLLHSWFPHAVAASILTTCTRNLRYGKRVERLTKDISEGVKSSVVESQLRLRLLTGITITRQFMDICGMASMKQVAAVVEISRVRHFVFISMITILFATVSVMRPVCEQILNSISALISSDSLHTWPIDWNNSFLEIRDIFITMFTRLYTLAMKEWVLIIENPFAVVSTVALVAVLLIFSQLSGMFKAYSSIASSKSPTELGVNTKDQEIDLIEKISAMGKSSATRLAVLLNDGSTDTIMAKWKRFQSSAQGMNLKTFIRQSPFHFKMTYSTLCWVLAFIPIAIETYVKINHTSILNWSHMVASMLLLNVTRENARNALFSTIDSASYNAILAPSLSLFAQIFTDIDKSKANTDAGRAISTSISNAGGLVVTDLWVAHVSKRSWACRGTSFECKPGEVIVILGDDGCGKTRLLTSLCELIVAPPNRARTTNYARGSVAVGGLDIKTWHRESLKRKLGIFLKGTRSTSDLAEFYSGSSLRDVLKPCSSSGIDESTIRSSMDLAMQFTNLSTTLLPRLENRLSSIVLSNEDDVSSTNDSFLLSHSDWSKVLLTKYISQSIFNNDNPMAPNNTLKNCLLGSIMFLDDITSSMNEVEEIKLINALKSSGATTLLTSSKWAVGRHADKIIILKNGSIVESGTHDDLLSRGTKNSLYAQRWSQIRA